MADLPIPGRKRLSMRRGLSAVLIAQAVLAVLLVGTDIADRWPGRFGPGEALPTTPVAPGDQVRRYDPRRGTPGPAPAGPIPGTMEFTLEPGGAARIAGPINQGDALRFVTWLDGLAEAPLIVALHSPGGSVDTALEIGRTIRARGMETAMTPGSVCMSACPYVLAAGVDRRVSAAAQVGMHQSYYDTPGYIPAWFAVEDIQHAQGRVMDYVVEMGVDPAVMSYSLNTPPNEIYVLVPEELTSTRLATEIVD